MKCANCGKELRKDHWTKYCTECMEAVENPEKTYKPTPEQRKRLKEAMNKINKVLEENLS